MDVAGSGAVAAVAAAGNANDHRRSTRRMPLVDAIVAAHIEGRARNLDLLRIMISTGGAEWRHYAHSYIGFGLTPVMAVGLKRDRNGLPRVFRTVELCGFMLRVARLGIRCGPRGGSGSPALSGVAADYRRFQCSGQCLVWLCSVSDRRSGGPARFEGGKKRFGERIVVTTSGAAQRLPDVQQGKFRGEFRRGVLGAMPLS